MKEAGLENPEDLVEKLRKKGELYEQKTGHYRTT